MKSPTVSKLQEGGFAIETVVEKSSVNRLIPLLKAARRERHPRAPDLEDRARDQRSRPQRLTDGAVRLADSARCLNDHSNPNDPSEYPDPRRAGAAHRAAC